MNREALFPPSTPLASGLAPVFSQRHMTVPEEILERQIDSAYDCLIRAQTPEGQQAAWEAMVNLCRQRTAERILQMEIQKGLR